MSGAMVVYVFVGLAVVALALGVWMLDMRRNKEVEHEEERFEPDPNVDPTDPTHHR